jgi:thiol-disulfide isomerase/thioredoxin
MNKRTDTRELILYGTSGCHLCEEAEALLDRSLRAENSPVRFQTVDIAENPELMERYGLLIPVLRDVESGIELNWPFRPEDIRKLL